ncbi:MAG: DNA-binding domain-containing protein [Candidatus Thiodiazotropha sp. 6PLUC2]
MQNLDELQARFQGFLLDPRNDEQNGWVSSGGRATPAYQLSVYANAYTSRLKEVLMNDYPAVNMAISSDQFDLLADGYIQQNPSHSFTLRDFGRRFRHYLCEKVDTDPAYHNMSWLSELADFEWKLGEAFDAADCDCFEEQEMASVPAEDWPMLQFQFAPCVGRLDLKWNVPEMWKALTADPPVKIDAIQETNPSGWLIWRQDLVTRFRSLEADEQLLLDTLRSGGTFNDACELLATRIDIEVVPMRAAGLLKGWINQGLIAALK